MTYKFTFKYDTEMHVSRFHWLVKQKNIRGMDWIIEHFLLNSTIELADDDQTMYNFKNTDHALHFWLVWG